MAWLESLQDPTSQSLYPSTLSFKRKAIAQLLISDMEEPNVTHVRKRLRGTDEESDILLRQNTAYSSTGSTLTIRTSEPATRPTKTNNTTKKKNLRLQISPCGLKTRPLSLESCPPSVYPLLITMSNIVDAVKILPHGRRDEIFASPHCCPSNNTEGWEHSFKTPAPHGDGQEEALPGRLPTLKEVVAIYKAAEECLKHAHDEMGWSVEVHHRLLGAVFRTDDNQSVDEFSYAFCTSARPDPGFLPPNASMRMVDLCIFAEKRHDKDWKRAHLKLARASTTCTVNHTDFQFLQLRPILMGIETKSAGKGDEKAHLQIGVWLAAQWEFLVCAADLSLEETGRDSQESPLTKPQAEQTLARGKAARARVKELPCIPGLIVEGHEWSLVISTYEKGHTTLWTGIKFGSTQSIKGVFKIVAGLREIAAWFRKVYLPWWQKNVLDGFCSAT